MAVTAVSEGWQLRNAHWSLDFYKDNFFVPVF